jgi:RimJ/RimL family protein N-acetyltransferase
MQLTTDRLLLRDFTCRDWPAVLAYQTDPLYLRYYEWTDRTAADVQEFVGMFLAQQQEQPRTRFQLAVCLKAGGQLIGNCGIRIASAESHEAEIGYELAPAQWGQGYATEAARSIVRFGFTQLRLHRISACCVADNTGSVRVLEKLGMRLEGRLRDKEYYKGRWWDSLAFGLLAEGWQAQHPA